MANDTGEENLDVNAEEKIDEASRQIGENLNISEADKEKVEKAAATLLKKGTVEALARKKAEEALKANTLDEENELGQSIYSETQKEAPQQPNRPQNITSRRRQENNAPQNAPIGESGMERADETEPEKVAQKEITGAPKTPSPTNEKNDPRKPRPNPEKPRTEEEPFGAPMGTTPEGIPETISRADQPNQASETSSDKDKTEEMSQDQKNEENEKNKAIQLKAIRKEAGAARRMAQTSRLVDSQRKIENNIQKIKTKIEKLKRTKKNLKRLSRSFNGCGCGLNITCVLALLGVLIWILNLLFFGTIILILRIYIAYTKRKLRRELAKINKIQKQLAK